MTGVFGKGYRRLRLALSFYIGRDVIADFLATGLLFVAPRGTLPSKGAPPAMVKVRWLFTTHGCNLAQIRSTDIKEGK